MSENRARWISATGAAKLLGVNSRAVQKRAARGSLPARKIGDKWEIDRDAMDASNGRSVDASTVEKVDAVDANHAQIVDASTGLNGRVHVDAVDASIVATDRSEIEVELRAQLAREREFSTILKNQLEAVTQSEAQTKAALREALRAMPKALPEAGAIQPQGGPRRDLIASDSPIGKVSAQRATDARESARVDYGAICDSLEAG